MNHSGFSSSPDNPCPNPASSATNAADSNPQEMARGVDRREPSTTDEAVSNLPVQTARADAATPKDSLPFVLQAGQILFLVAEEASDWVVAELRFDSVSCIFAEERRARFQWPREAFGRLLSRTIVGGNVDPDEANRIADAFTRWLASQFVTGAHANRG